MACLKRNISERLALALWPDEFPDESREIREHVQDCPECREELNMLERTYEVLMKNRNELGTALSKCPPIETIIRFAKGEEVESSISLHVEQCAHCTQEIGLVKESLQSQIPVADDKPSDATMLRVKQTVAREYAGAEEGGRRSVVGFLRDFLTGFRFPMLVGGAVAAAALLVVLMPNAPNEAPFRVALSTAVWDTAPPTVNKTGDPFESPGKARKKVALVVLVKESSHFSPKDLDDIYRRIEIPDRLSESYDFLSPAELIKVLAEFQGKGVHTKDLAQQVFGKTDAQDFLAFRIESDQAATTLKATLFRRGEGAAVGSLSQSGLQKDVLPQRIMGISADLLFGSPRS